MLDIRAQTSTPPLDTRLARLAGRQYGVVARTQLLALGFTRSAIATRVRGGRLHRLHSGVYAVGHAQVPVKGRWLAAVLACGPGAVLSHRSAARLWGLLGGTGTLVDVSSTRRPRARHPVRVHRTRTLSPADISAHERIPVTSVARTLLDLGEVAPPRHVERALNQAEVLRLLDGRAITAVLERADGRRGAMVLRAALDAPPVFTRSEFEEALVALVRATGLPAPRMNTFVEGWEVDAYWPQHKLAVELDSRRFHHTAHRFEADRARDVELLKAGVRTARITDKRLSEAPDDVAVDLRILLGDRRR
jgi:very-short-patch-repair endonuclease